MTTPDFDGTVRNTLGRVCNDIVNGTIPIPCVMSDRTESAICARWTKGTPMENEGRILSQRLADVLPVIAGSTAVAVNEEELPMPTFDYGDEWLNLFAGSVWIDFTSPPHRTSRGSIRFSAWAFTPEEMGWGADMINRNPVDYDRMIFMLPFGHSRNRAYRKINGHSYVSMVDSGLIAICVRDNNFFLGMCDLNSLGLAQDEMWPDKMAAERLIADKANRLMRVLFAVNMLSNVKLERVAPANKIPKHERSYPKIAYHVLKLERSKGAVSPKLKEQFRASPRRHMRRGHVRRLVQQHKITWIRPCIIGDADQGSIIKDYIV